MNYNFTDRCRKVIGMAREEAIRLGHDYVGTEHLLLGLIREREGVAAAVFSQLSIDPTRVREAVEANVRQGKAMMTRAGELPYTSRAKKVLEFSLAEARELKHSYVGTEHLLLGLLREASGMAAEVLSRQGLTQERARAQTLKLLGQPAPEKDPPVAPPDDDVIVVQIINGEQHRVLETYGRTAREGAQKIGRDGVWITGAECFFIPPTAILKVQLFARAEWERGHHEGT